MLLADLGKFFKRRVPQANPAVDAADLDLAQLRLFEFAPSDECPTRVMLPIPAGDGLEILAHQVHVVPDKWTLDLDARLGESFGFSMVTDEIWKDNELFELNGEVVARFTDHTCEGMTA